MLLLVLLAILLGLPLCLILYRTYEGTVIYNRAVKAFGKKNVVYLNYSYLTSNAFLKKNACGSDCMSLYTRELVKNPDMKIIVVSVLQITSYLVCDLEMVRKISQEYVRNVEKQLNVVFVDAIKGLIFTDGSDWKKSRGIISGLFHFEMLKNREGIMHEVVDRFTRDLHERKEVNLFKLGCTIGGEVVVESLFGKDFTEVRFGKNTPLEEIQLLITELLAETFSPAFIFRSVVFGRLMFSSKFLIPSQTRVKERLINLKKMGSEYLQLQKEKLKKGEPIAPFVEVFLNLNDESYYDEVIQHLIIFLIAGQDTTGSLIEMCLYYLAEFPEHQAEILKALEEEPNVHANKTLNNFIQEVMRINGPVRCTILRDVVEPFIIDGFEFKKGEVIRQWLGATMINVKYFDEPMKFNPNRFNRPL